MATKPKMSAANPFEYGSPAWALFDHYQVAARTEFNTAEDVKVAKKLHDAAKAKSRSFERAIRAVTGKKCPPAYTKEGGRATRR